VRYVVLACVVVLLLAQGLIGALSLSAIDTLARNNAQERLTLVTRQMAADIQNGLNLGKPLAQYFGLERQLQPLAEQLPGLHQATVSLQGGDILARIAGTAQAASVHASAALRDSGGAQGVLAIDVDPRSLGVRTLTQHNLMVLGGVTFAALLVLLLVFRYIMPLHQLAMASRTRLLVPLCIMLLAQGVYAAFTIQSFRTVWLQVASENAQMLGQRVQRDLNRVLGYGIAPERLVGVEQSLARQAAAFPLVQQLVITNADNQPLFAANANGKAPLPVNDAPADSAGVSQFALGAARAGEKPPAWLQVHLDQQQIVQGVRERIADAATVVIVAMVASFELLLLLGVLMDRAFAAPRSQRGIPAGLDDLSRVGSVVRPVMFGFMFAVALPLSFIPLHARNLISAAGLEPAGLPMALPVAVEMGCGLLTALWAGRLTDRRGWAVPVLAGLAAVAAGAVMAAFAHTLAGFVAARALVGLGYGLTWMGLQGFIVLASPSSQRGRNMASVIAGLFAGHLSGAAVGALLAEQAGASWVFLLNAGMLILPLAGVLTLMWPYRELGQAVSVVPAPVSARAGRLLRQLLVSRDFGLLLLGSVIPFSVAQVGLLSFALPLYVEQANFSTASTGRVLMAYGLCVIYVAPWVARMADRSRARKPWIVAGGLAGSLGLFGLYLANGIIVATVAVVMLALASCLAGGAQASYMLSRRRVQDYGPAAATSVMRAGDKLGQMLGPLVVGAALGALGIAGSLALVGGIYFAATLAFWLWAPGDQPVESL
jgi:predicted MFS family arabinose efflux permease